MANRAVPQKSAGLPACLSDRQARNDDVVVIVTATYKITSNYYEGGNMSKLSILKEFWDFLKVRKKWWLTPIILVLLLLGVLIVFTQGSALSPFIYTLF